MKVALITTCKGRTAHLRATLPENLQFLGQDALVVLLDYNDTEGLGDYIQAEHRADLDSGRLVYYRNSDAPRFHMAHAKNQAHRCALLEGAWFLVNVDADNFTGPGFSDYVVRRFKEGTAEEEAVFLGARGNHRGPGGLTKVRTPPGCFGRIAVTADAFRQAGGYDEIFAGWSPDDKDFANRVANLGYCWRRIRTSFLRSIKHGHGLRFQEYALQTFDEVEWLTQRKNLTVVNAGVVGTGTVQRNFSPEVIDLPPIPARVFGVGLHRTGTTSLAQAFRVMGLDAAHWESPHWAKYIWDEMQAQGRSRTLEMHYALCDLPIPLLFRQLDAAYPGSRFVLTVRDEATWLESVRTHWRLRHQWDGDVFSNMAHKLLYGQADFDAEVFLARYRRHNSEVREYFAGRTADFMEVTINEHTSMAPLCRFLGMSAMNRPFPHKHKSADQEKYNDRS